jgi:hypothetical protein
MFHEPKNKRAEKKFFFSCHSRKFGFNRVTVCASRSRHNKMILMNRYVLQQ